DLSRYPQCSPHSGGGGLDHQGGLRGLRRADADAVLAPRSGSGDGQPRRAQEREGQGAHRREGLFALVPAALLAGLLAHRGGFQQDKGALEEGPKARRRPVLV
ncbi:MAG: hypothetical protein AVDCRST_MAG22-3827, partial [uncultured Rubrobacteraceae bacterium]